MDAPPGFAERVMARSTEATAPIVAASSQNNANGWWSALLAWRMAGAFAVLLAVVTAGLLHWERVREQHRSAAAAAQFDEAMQVTDRALDHASAQLDRTPFAVVARMLQQNGGK